MQSSTDISTIQSIITYVTEDTANEISDYNIEEVAEEEIEYVDLDDELFLKLVDERLYRHVKWTELETGWILLWRKAEEFHENGFLGKIIGEIFSASFAGELLSFLNYQQPSDADLQEKKLEIIKHSLTLNEFPNVYQRLNYFVDDIVELIETCMKSNPHGIVTIHSLLSHTPLLRLTNCKIYEMDHCLIDYENLQALILASNYLKDFPGSYLPRNLRLLELYGNVLQNVTLLCTDAPVKVVYLGIGRNYLNYNSDSIHYLLSFKYLCHLDLSDNDFESVEELLEIFSEFLKLQSLQLIGNPCSLTTTYKLKVQQALPNLLYLDGEPLGESLQSGKLDNEKDFANNEACLQIYCYRLMGMLAPKQERTYRLEIELPLLDENLRQFEIIKQKAGEIVENSIPEEDLEEYLFPHHSTERTTKKSLVSNVELMKKNDIKMITENYNKYLSKDKPFPVENKFVSKEIKWSKIMNFENPCIEIPVEEAMLKKLRDTLRSVVTLRVVRVKPQSRGNKSTKKKKKKTAGKAKKFKSQLSLTTTNAEGSGEIPIKEEKSTLISSDNETVAKILVPLQMIKWNENSVGYMWDIKRFCLARPYPNIENVKYKGEISRKSDEVPKKNSEVQRKSRVGSTSNSNGKKEYLKEIPPYLTCHFGIGLKRGVKSDKKEQEVAPPKLNRMVLKKMRAAAKRETSSLKTYKMEPTLLTLVEKLDEKKILFSKIQEELELYKETSKKHLKPTKSKHKHK